MSGNLLPRRRGWVGGFQRAFDRRGRRSGERRAASGELSRGLECGRPPLGSKRRGAVDDTPTDSNSRAWGAAGRSLPPRTHLLKVGRAVRALGGDQSLDASRSLLPERISAVMDGVRRSPRSGSSERAPLFCHLYSSKLARLLVDSSAGGAPAGRPRRRTRMSTQVGEHRNWITQVVREALSSGSNSELLKALVEAFPGSWFFTRLDATFAYVNQRACDTLGYSREELMALTLYDVDANMSQELWDSLLEMGPFVPASVRTVHRRKDGSTFPVEAFGSRVILNDENVAVSYVVDISDEAKAKEALAEKEQLLQSLLDQAPIIMWVIGIDERFELSEGSGLSAIGLTPGHAVGKTVGQLFPDIPEMVDATRRALSGEAVDGDVALGSVHFTYRYVPRLDEAGVVIGATGVAFDITARRSAEQANRRLQTAIEQSAEAVILMDAGGLIEYVNPAFEATTGRTQSEVRGLNWARLNSAEAVELAPDLLQALESGSGWRGTLQGVRKNGSDYVEQVTLSPMRDAEEHLTGFVAVSRDISEQVRTQERLRQAQKMDAIGQLAGGVAHDFNNLLQVIFGSIQLCFRQNVAPETEATLREMEHASERAARLVNQLLTFARKDTVEWHSVALDSLVGRLINMVQRLLGEHIVVEFRPTDSPLHVWGDESQLEQIVINLCTNARDAMPAGGRITIALEPHEITESEAIERNLVHGGRYVFLDVRDTGCGMTDAVRSRIFEPFFTTKGDRSGTGLGLATVYSVVRRHNGCVEVESVVGEGSRFRVCIPLSTNRQAEALTSLSERPFSAARSGLVLLAEDDPSVHQLIRAFLEMDGHPVLSAIDGPSAIALIEQRGAEFALAIIDAIMPGANGPEVYRALRRISTVPVIFVTGYEFNALEALPEDPARALLRKPFESQQLRSLARSMMEEHAERRIFTT